MTRNIFLILFIIPFVAVAFFRDFYFILICVFYVWLLQALRLKYLGFNVKEIMLAYTPFGIKHWLRIWERDN